MRDSRDSNGPVLAIVVVTMLVPLTVGAVALMWWSMMRQRQEALVQREHAAAAQAAAVAERQLAEAMQANRSWAEPPEGSRHDLESIEASIRKVLLTQQQAWNAGDIDQFMESYWKSDDLTFSSGGKLTRSWQRTLDSYKERYPSRREMGKLSFLELEVTPLGSDSAFVLGEWRLRRESDDLGGKFTLVFRRLSDKWVIVHDHTSRAVPD